MATYKATFIFVQGRQGWSETYYITTSTQALAASEARTLATKRAMLLGLGAELEAFRLSDVDVPRICALETLSLWTQAELQTDVPWTSWIVNVCAGNLHRRSLLLRCIPDAWTVWEAANNRWVVFPALKDAVANFMKALVKGPWQLRVISKNPVDVQLQALAEPVNADGYVKFLGNFPGIAVGDSVRISKFTGPDAKALNGVTTVRAVAAGLSVTLNLTATFLTDPAANGGGKLGRRVIRYENITEGSLLRPAKKSTGRAFFVPRGRRSRRV